MINLYSKCNGVHSLFQSISWEASSINGDLVMTLGKLVLERVCPFPLPFPDLYWSSCIVVNHDKVVADIYRKRMGKRIAAVV